MEATDDAITRYVRAMAQYDAAVRRVVAREAASYVATGQQQQLYALVGEKDDAAATWHRLARYQAFLGHAKAAGRYDGATDLKRVLPDGRTEPWIPHTGRRALVGLVRRCLGLG